MSRCQFVRNFQLAVKSFTTHKFILKSVLFKNTRTQDVYRLLNDVFICNVNYFIGIA